MATRKPPTAFLRRTRSTRWSVLLAAVLVAALIPLHAGAIDRFADVGADDTHAPAIEALDQRNVFAGTECQEGHFCPEHPVERWVMAVWMIRALGRQPAELDTSRFADVDSAEWWSPYAEALAAAEITAGCGSEPLVYCPQQYVSRAQMATFFVRAFSLASAPTAGFTDTQGNTHASNIDALAAAEITAGCRTEPLRYCPDAKVTRAQMATFLHKALLGREAQVPGLSEDLPTALLTDMATGNTTSLGAFFTGDQPVMLWFWAYW